MDRNRSLKRALAGIVAVVTVAGTWPAGVRGQQTFTPLVASAADETEKTVVEVTAENAEELLTSMQANTIYKVSGDLNVSAIHVVGAGAELLYSGTAAGKITTTDDTKRGIYVDPDASLTISGASKKLTIDITGSKDGQATVDDRAALTLKANAGVLGTIAYFEGAVINVEGGTVTCEAEEGFAICGNHDWSEGSVLNITSGTVESKNGIAVYHPQNGTVNMTGGTVKGRTAFFARTGVLNISGGTVTGSGEAISCFATATVR